MATIFIVDDDPLILKSLSRIFSRAGFDVVSFEAPEPAIARLNEAPDFLICDYHLPRIDGLAVSVAAKNANPKIRTMLLSGGVEDDAVIEALAAKKVDKFATKPWRQGELVAMVQEMLKEP
jgi:two-component system, probable response regulator PhcQ